MPAPGVPLRPDAVGVRYVTADGETYVWTAGPGMVSYTVEMLRQDAGCPRSVEAVRWNGVEWITTDGRWPFGNDDDEDLLRRYLSYDGFTEDDEVYQVEHALQLRPERPQVTVHINGAEL